MKIAFLVNNYSSIGGIERAVSLISNELSKDNHISLISLYSIGKNNLYKYKENIDINIINKKNKKNYILDFRNSIKQIKKIIEKNNYDYLIYCGELLSLYALLSCKNSRTKCIYWSHSSPLNFEEFIFQKQLKYIAFTKSFYNITLTNKSKQLIMNKYHIKNVDYIPNPIDPALLDIKNEYNINSKRIITVGRICYEKNYEKLIDVAKIVLNELNDWNWDVYGDGDKNLKNKLMLKAKNNKLDNRLTFFGNVENIYSLYNDYAMIVMTSRTEGFPMTLLEGYAKGLPLVSFDILTGPSEIINENNGVLISPFDEQKMAKEIIRLANSQEIRINMSKYNVDNIYKYDINAISNKWREIFKVISNSN